MSSVSLASTDASSPTRTRSRKKLPLRPSQHQLHARLPTFAEGSESGSSRARSPAEFDPHPRTEPPLPSSLATANLRRAAVGSRVDLLSRGVSVHAAMGSVVDFEDDEVETEGEERDSGEISPSVYSQQEHDREEEEEEPPPPVAPLKLKGRQADPPQDEKDAVRARLGLDRDVRPPAYPPLTIDRDPDHREGLSEKYLPNKTQANLDDEETDQRRRAREEAEARLVADQRLEKARAERERAEAHARELALAERALEAELVKGVDTMRFSELEFAPTRYDRPPPPSTISVAHPQTGPSPAPATLPLDNSGKGHDALPSDPYWNPGPPPERDESESNFEQGTVVPAYERAQPSPPDESMRATPLPAFTSRANTFLVQPARMPEHPKEQFFSEARREDWRRANGLEDWVRETNEAMGVQTFEGQQAFSNRTNAPQYRSYQLPPRTHTPLEAGRRPYSTQAGYPGSPSSERSPPLAHDKLPPSSDPRVRAPEQQRRDTLSPTDSVAAAGFYGGSLGVAMRTADPSLPAEMSYERRLLAPEWASPQSADSHPSAFQSQSLHSLHSARRHHSNLPHPSEFEHAVSARQQRRFTTSPVGGAPLAGPSTGFGALPPPPAPHSGYTSMPHLPAPGRPFSAAPISRGGGYGPGQAGPPPTGAAYTLQQRQWEAEVRQQQFHAQQNLRPGMDHRGSWPANAHPRARTSGGSVAGSNSPPAGSVYSAGAETKSRKQSVKQLLKGFGGGSSQNGKGKQRMGEFEQTGEKTTLLWGWT